MKVQLEKLAFFLQVTNPGLIPLSLPGVIFKLWSKRNFLTSQGVGPQTNKKNKSQENQYVDYLRVNMFIETTIFVKSYKYLFAYFLMLDSYWIVPCPYL